MLTALQLLPPSSLLKTQSGVSGSDLNLPPLFCRQSCLVSARREVGHRGEGDGSGGRARGQKDQRKAEGDAAADEPQHRPRLRGIVCSSSRKTVALIDRGKRKELARGVKTACATSGGRWYNRKRWKEQNSRTVLQTYPLCRNVSPACMSLEKHGHFSPPYR